MAIIVEDGSIVDDADSYVSRADYIAYAATLGITIADVDATDSQLRKATQYIDQHEDNLKGVLVERDQPLAYPRGSLSINGWYWASDEIPRNVILCQMAYALDINAGFDPWNPDVNPNQVVKSERVEGAVAVVYAVKDSKKLNRSSTADALLNSLLLNSGLYSIALVRA